MHEIEGKYNWKDTRKWCTYIYTVLYIYTDVNFAVTYPWRARSLLTGDHCPKVSCALACLAALAEVRIDGEVVPDWVLPAVVIRAVVREVLSAHTLTPAFIFRLLAIPSVWIRAHRSSKLTICIKFLICNLMR